MGHWSKNNQGKLTSRFGVGGVSPWPLKAASFFNWGTGELTNPPSVLKQDWFAAEGKALSAVKQNNKQEESQKGTCNASSASPWPGMNPPAPNPAPLKLDSDGTQECKLLRSGTISSNAEVLLKEELTSEHESNLSL